MVNNYCVFSQKFYIENFLFLDIFFLLLNCIFVIGSSLFPYDSLRIGISWLTKFGPRKNNIKNKKIEIKKNTTTIATCIMVLPTISSLHSFVRSFVLPPPTHEPKDFLGEEAKKKNFTLVLPENCHF